MAVIIPTNAVEIARFANGLFGLQLGFATSNQVAGDVSAYGGLNAAFNNYYTLAYGSATTASVAAAMTANLGITAANGVAAADITNATAYITAQLNAAPASARGAVVKSVLDMWANISSDPVNGAKYGTAATAWNNQIASAVTYAGAINPDITLDVAATVGSSFALTTGADAFVGTSGNDTFNAIASDTGASTDTFTALDSVVGGSGSDTLNVVFTGTNNATTLATASVSGVETVNIRAALTTAATVTTVNAGNFAGVTSVNADRATSAITITNLPTGASAAIVGNGSITNGDLIIGYKTTANAATINVSGGANGGAVGVSTNPTSVTISSTSGAQTTTAGQVNTVGAIDLSASGSITAMTINADTSFTATSLSDDFTSATTDKLTVSGNATLVTLGTLPATLDSVDASGLTSGGVSVTAGAVTQSVKGGAGKDTVVAFEGNLTTGSYDGGAGSSDVITFTSGTYYAANASKVTNFETLRATPGATTTLNFAAITGLTALETSGAQTLTVTNLGANTPVTVRGDEKTDGKALTLALADATGATDSLNITLKNSTAATAVALGLDGTGDGLITAGIETVNVTSADAVTGTTGNTIYIAGTTTGLNSVVATAASDSALTFNSSQYAALTSFDASADTKKVTTTTAAPATTLIIKGGTASDTFNFTNSTLTNAVTLDGGAGTSDTIAIADTGTIALADSAFTSVSNVEKVTVTVTATPVLNFTAGGFFQGAFGGAHGKVQFDATALGAATASTLDFSGVTNDITSTFTVGNGTTASGNGAKTLKGGFGDDILTIAGAGTTGSIVLSGGAGNDTLKYSGSDDASYTGGAGADTYDFSAGTGADSAVFAALTDSKPATFDQIIGYTPGTDTIDLATPVITAVVATNVTAAVGATNGIATGLFTFDKAAATSLADAIAKVGTDVHTAGNAVVFNYAGDAYFFADVDGTTATTNDILVKLVGVTAASVAAAAEVFTVS